MTTTTIKPRTSWENRFKVPGADDLLGALPKPMLALVDQVRAHLGGVGLREEIAWQGVPWRWSMVYRSESDAERAWALVVPEPVRPRLVVPLTTDVIGRLPSRKLSRPVRDGIIQATEVAGVYWAAWDLPTKAQTEELLLIVAAKAEALAPLAAAK